MATRSFIGIKNEDGSVDSIYCHWDGYVENNGQILCIGYTTEEKIRMLISHGSASSLGLEIGEKHDFMEDTPKDNETGLFQYCTFYHRDQDEDLHFEHHDTVEDYKKNALEYCSYGYLWQEGAWYVADSYGNQYVKVEDYGTEK